MKWSSCAQSMEHEKWQGMDKKIANSAKGGHKISSFDEQTTGVDPKKARREHSTRKRLPHIRKLWSSIHDMELFAYRLIRNLTASIWKAYKIRDVKLDNWQLVFTVRLAH